MDNGFKIIDARPEDAPFIARAIMLGVGEEICRAFAGSDHTLADVEALFAALAALDDSQYSYRNAQVALAPDGAVAGVCVAYDGALLHRLRLRFFEAVRERLSRDMTSMEDETSPDEFYVDTLAVFEPYRRRGVARMLLEAAGRRAAECDKPCGLLVDKDNSRARALYESVGFRYVGDRPFASVMMDHLQIPRS